MTYLRFTPEQLEQPITAFHQYAQEQHILVTFPGKAPQNRRLYLVEQGDQFLEIVFSVQGGITFSRDDAYSMDIRTIIRPWVEQEQPRYHQHALSQRALWLAAARHPHLFSQPPLLAEPTSLVTGCMQLWPEDHPLVALATWLGYGVFLSTRRDERYQVVGNGRRFRAPSLLEVLVLLIEHRQESQWQSSSGQTSAEGR